MLTNRMTPPIQVRPSESHGGRGRMPTKSGRLTRNSAAMSVAKYVMRRHQTRFQRDSVAAARILAAAGSLNRASTLRSSIGVDVLARFNDPAAAKIRAAATE